MKKKKGKNERKKKKVGISSASSHHNFSDKVNNSCSRLFRFQFRKYMTCIIRSWTNLTCHKCKHSSISHVFCHATFQVRIIPPVIIFSYLYFLFLEKTEIHNLKEIENKLIIFYHLSFFPFSIKKIIYNDCNDRDNL